MNTIAIDSKDLRQSRTLWKFKGARRTESAVRSPVEVVRLQPGDELELGFATDGMRAYVCVQGGVDVPEVRPGVRRRGGGETPRGARMKDSEITCTTNEEFAYIRHAADTGTPCEGEVEENRREQKN